MMLLRNISIAFLLYFFAQQSYLFAASSSSRPNIHAASIAKSFYYIETNQHKSLSTAILWCYGKKTCEHAVTRSCLTFSRITAPLILLHAIKTASLQYPQESKEYIYEKACEKLLANVPAGKYLDYIDMVQDFQTRKKPEGLFWHEACNQKGCNGISIVPPEAAEAAALISKFTLPGYRKEYLPKLLAGSKRLKCLPIGLICVIDDVAAHTLSQKLKDGCDESKERKEMYDDIYEVFVQQNATGWKLDILSHDTIASRRAEDQNLIKRGMHSNISQESPLFEYLR